MKLFVPAVGYRILLTQKWDFELYYEHRNRTLVELLDFEYKPGDITWQTSKKHFQASFPEGTLLEVDRVYVRTANKSSTGDEDYDSLTFKVVEHPHYKKIKKIRFWAKLADVNKIEYELPTDFTAGKDKAVQNKKKPKMTPERIRKEVYGLWMTYGRKKTPKWYDKKAREEFRAITEEYARIHDPWWKQHSENHRQEQIANLRKEFDRGGISLPMNLASQIKTFEDLEKSGQYAYIFNRNQGQPRQHDVEYTISRVVMGHSFGVKTNEDGTRTRTFRPDKTRHGISTEPQYDHLWVSVTTNVDDDEIVSVTGGIDKVEDAKSK